MACLVNCLLGLQGVVNPHVMHRDQMCILKIKSSRQYSFVLGLGMMENIPLNIFETYSSIFEY